MSGRGAGGGERKIPRSRTTGKPCGHCSRMYPKRCRNHGGKSTGPRTREGKREARTNPTTHGLYSDPAVWRDSLSPAREKQFRQLVDVIARAEGVRWTPESVEDVGEDAAGVSLVEDLVTVLFLTRQGSAYLLERGLITAEVWHMVPTGNPEMPVVRAQDVAGEDVRAAVVPGEVLKQWRTLVRLKSELLRALRQGTGRPGDPGRHHHTHDHRDMAASADRLARELEREGVNLEELEQRLAHEHAPTRESASDEDDETEEDTE